MASKKSEPKEKVSAMDRLERGRDGVDRVIYFVDWIRGVFSWLMGLVGR